MKYHLAPELERRLLVSVLHAAEQAPYPYDVRQAEFQVDDGKVAWVVRITDPIPPLGDTPLPFDTEDVILRWPVAMYRDAVTPLWDELGLVDTFLLAISDEGSSVYQIPPDLLRQYASEVIGCDEVLNRMTIWRLTGGA